MQTIWKGSVQFSLVNIPVRLYSAVDSAKTINFDWLTKDEHHHVGYTKTDKTTGEPLEKEDIVKGYEYEPDQYVIIEDEDIDKMKPESTQVIKIIGFISEDDTHPTLYSKPYFLGPESDSAVETYRLFTKTLEETGKMAVGKVAIRDKEAPVLLAPYEDGILMYKLRYPNQIRSMEDVPNLGHEDVDEEQLEMAKELVEKMTKSFSDIDLENHYYQNMEKMIDQKVEGKEVVSVDEEEEAEPKDIMTALKKSINSTNGNSKENGKHEQLSDLKKDELYEKAEKADIKGRSKMNKDELIKALEKK